MERVEQIILTGLFAGALIGTGIAEIFFYGFQALGTVLGGVLGGYVSWIAYKNNQSSLIKQSSKEREN